MNKKPTVFVSYNSGSSKAADKIAEQLENLAEVQRYETDVKISESFREFMSKITTANYAVSIISEAYLKSEPCMCEAINAAEHVRNVYYILDKAASNLVYSPIGRAKVVSFWLQKEREFKDSISDFPQDIKNQFTPELDRYSFICTNAANTLRHISDTRNFPTYTTVLEIKNVLKNTRFDSKEADIRNAILSVLYENTVAEEKVVYTVNKSGTVGRTDLQKVIGRSKTATLNVINKMIAAGVLFRTGKGSSVAYSLVQEEVIT